MQIFHSPGRGARRARHVLLLACGLSISACGLSNKARGTAIGTTAGAAAGAVVGDRVGSTARGAIIGAVVGGAAGAIIGSRMDAQAAALEAEIEGAAVERIGEGLVVTFDSGILFDFDSEAIRSEAATQLRALAASLAEYRDTRVLIVGHTDSRGATDYNDALSLRRARAASQVLTGQGIATSRIQVEGRGEMEPLASNQTEDGRQTNRRIEVAIYAAPASAGR